MDHRTRYLSAAVFSLAVSGAGALAISDKLLDEVEGDSALIAYQDYGGVWTNCRGNTHDVDPTRRMTRDECDKIDRDNTDRYLKAVDRNVKVPISETTRAGLAVFVYNLGESNFRRSTLLRKLNAGDTLGACAELSRWTYIGNTDCRGTRGSAIGCYGIVRRREMERELCEMSP